MIIDCISDLHGYYPKLEGGDLLIVAGDLTARDRPEEYVKFSEWLLKQNYRKKIVIAGNHDGCIEHGYFSFTPESEGVSYLCDSGTEFEGLKIWGSPYTPTFLNWHFMRDRGPDIKKHWDLIPKDTDILVTHGPPWGILDEVARGDHVENTGCRDLLRALGLLKLKLHVFGHIHEGHGRLNENDPTKTLFVNASFVDEYYRPVHKPVRMIL